MKNKENSSKKQFDANSIKSMRRKRTNGEKKTNEQD